MTISTEKSPLIVGAVSEAKELGKHSVATAYLAEPRNNTTTNFGTLSGQTVPRDGNLLLVIDVRAVAEMAYGGPLLVQINPDCVESNNRILEEQRIEEEVRKEELIRAALDKHFQEVEFSEALKACQEAEEEIWRRIDRKFETIINSFGNEIPSFRKVLDYVDDLEGDE